MFKRIQSYGLLTKLIWLFIYKNILFYIVKLYFLRKHFPNKHSAIESTKKKLGHTLGKTLQNLGPSFIKLGQAFSTRPDLFGETIAQELTDLQDKLPPFPFAEVKKTLEREFVQPINKLYSHIDPVPVAAASIAQVHKAKTLDGQVVAIKVLRPNIEKKFARDLELFAMMANTINRLFPLAKRFRLVEVVNTLKEIVKFELDLRFEAASADQIRENTQEDEGIYIPKVFWSHTAKRVITLEWIDGISVNETAKLVAAGHDLHEIAKKLAVSFFNQAYRDGFFHADLHPGNIFVDPKGNIALVDFGIIGILKPADRIFIAQMLHSFINRDYKRVAELHFQAGYVPNHKDVELFTLACRSIGEPIVGLPVNQISIGRLLKQLFDISKSFNMVPQMQLLLLQKTMVTIEGVGYSIYPEVNMWQLAEPWIREWAEQNFSIKSKLKNVKNSFANLSQDVPKILSYITKAADRFENAQEQRPVEVVGADHGISMRRHVIELLVAFGLGLIAALSF